MVPGRGGTVGSKVELTASQPQVHPLEQMMSFPAKVEGEISVIKVEAATSYSSKDDQVRIGKLHSDRYYAGPSSSTRTKTYAKDY